MQLAFRCGSTSAASRVATISTRRSKEHPRLLALRARDFREHAGAPRGLLPPRMDARRRAQQAKSVGADAPAPRADESLWEYFHRKDIDIWSAKNRLLTPVLAFDQFEEMGQAERHGRGCADIGEHGAPLETGTKKACNGGADAGQGRRVSRAVYFLGEYGSADLCSAMRSLPSSPRRKTKVFSTVVLLPLSSVRVTWPIVMPSGPSM